MADARDDTAPVELAADTAAVDAHAPDTAEPTEHATDGENTPADDAAEAATAESTGAPEDHAGDDAEADAPANDVQPTGASDKDDEDEPADPPAAAEEDAAGDDEAAEASAEPPAADPVEEAAADGVTAGGEEERATAPVEPEAAAETSPKTPKAGKATRAKSPASGSTRRGRSPAASSKRPGAATPATGKKPKVQASAHIPKRALSFGRNLDDGVATDAASPAGRDDAGTTPIRRIDLDATTAGTGAEAEASPIVPTTAESPQPHDLGRTVASIDFNASVVVRKPTLRLYGEVAESDATDPKTRAAALFNIGWIYGTGTTGVALNTEKAYAYFYHAALAGHPRARFHIAMLQLNRPLGAAPPFDPATYGDDASPRRGRSASPRRARSASPRRAAGSPGAKASKSGPFGGLTRAVEGLKESIATHGMVEAMVLLGQLCDPAFPAPPGYVDPAVAAGKAAAAGAAPGKTAGPAARLSKTNSKATNEPSTPRRSAAAMPALASPTAAASPGSPSGGKAAKAPVIERSHRAALEYYRMAAEAGSVAARMRIEDIEAEGVELAKEQLAAEAAAAAA